LHRSIKGPKANAGGFGSFAFGKWFASNAAWFYGSGWKTQNPNPKIQTNSKVSNSKTRGLAPSLELGVWSLFGFWILGFGISRTEGKTFDPSTLKVQ
jgi:hypothetical protein